ncbi:MAG: MFS transporter [Pseudomonadales bacterium]|nr:MFS transporter [Pseudomonadales bacterium]MCP5331345.1 MFS transporter [Pseudomonadales bacterium]MCP5344355.1 MFS transporter [Pseudomonadales bacterium]
MSATQDGARPALIPLIGISMLCNIVTVVFARLAYGLLLPGMQETLGLSFTQAALLGTVTALGYLSLVLPAGLFAARFGARRAIMLGTCCAVLGFSGMSQASSFPLLIVLMLCLGAATAFSYTPLISLLGAWYPERRGIVIGWANSGVGSGMFLTGALVPVLTTQSEGWRQAWLLFAIIAIVCMLLAWRVLQNPPRMPTPANPAIRAASLGSALRNPHVLLVAWIYGIIGVTYILQSLFMYSFALESGISAGSAGQLVALMGILSIFASPAWGWAADRIGHERALLICLALGAMGTLLPVLWPVYPAFLLHYFVLGASTTGQFTSILASATRTVSREQAAVTISFITLFFAAGQLLGPSLGGLLLEKTHDFPLMFALSSLLIAIGALLSWRSGRGA